MLVAEYAPAGTRLVVLSVYHTTNAPPEIFSRSRSIVYMESRILTKHYLCGNGLHEVVQRAVHARAVDLSVARGFGIVPDFMEDPQELFKAVDEPPMDLDSDQESLAASSEVDFGDV